MGIDTGQAGDSGRQSIIYTVTAHCQDCYRCVRACPVKAIQVTVATDVVSKLGVTIGFSDADGDTGA